MRFIQVGGQLLPTPASLLGDSWATFSRRILVFQRGGDASADGSPAAAFPGHVKALTRTQQQGARGLHRAQSE